MNGSLLAKAALGLMMAGITGLAGWAWSISGKVTATDTRQNAIIMRLDRIEDKLDRLIERQ